MFENLGGFLTSIIGGGVTGILGVAVQRFADYKNKQLDMQASRERMAHEIEMRKVDVEIVEREAQARVQVADIDAQAREAVADTQAFAASYQLEPQRYSDSGKISSKQSWIFVFLDFIRGIVRPGLTIYLCVVTTAMYVHAISLAEREGFAMTGDQAYTLVQRIVETVLYLSTTCLLWWFGVRNRGKQAGLK